ncbi:MAG: carbamate kinase [Clostridiales bacterium]|jgi:carbamate kinase|nr:carbamate kinase [Clostridiales bacterium]
MKAKRRIVVALGGNALGNTPEAQKKLVRKTAETIADLVEAGHELVIAHGNGPQVGMINLAMDMASKSLAKTPEMPFPECGAMSQGYIGYHLQNAIRESLMNRGIDKPVVSLVTQVVVDPNDPAFKAPSKPIGAFYTKVEAAQMVSDRGFVMKEDAGRGYRRVVASPQPLDVVEKETVKALLALGQLVITVGGGGIPVYREGNALVGIDAVIDKDFASEKIAELVDADELIILTAVEKVAIGFGTPEEKWLDKMSVDEAQTYIEAGYFAAGSMLPKVRAAMRFAASAADRRSLITALEKAKEGIEGDTGTVVYK